MRERAVGTGVSDRGKRVALGVASEMSCNVAETWARSVADEGD